jgi:C-terminal processing protease CtpA/Prc
MKQFLSGAINPLYNHFLYTCRLQRSGKKERIGLIIEHSDQMVIEYVIPNSRADQANLSRNDVILSVNGVIAHDFLKSDIIRKLQESPRLEIVVDKDAGYFQFPED